MIVNQFAYICFPALISDLSPILGSGEAPYKYNVYVIAPRRRIQLGERSLGGERSILDP